MAAPMPFAPPVTRIIFPFNCRSTRQPPLALLKRHSSLPRNKSLLPLGLRLGTNFSTGYLNNRFQHLFAHSFDRFVARNDSSGIDINDVRHTLREGRIGREL